MRNIFTLFYCTLFVCLVFSAVVASAQTDSNPVYELHAATVTADRKIGVSDIERFSVGGTTYQADSAKLALLRHTSLTSLINQQTPVYVRESGSGMMATVSLRGTASAHTAVTWNGITINSLTMGQTDFSHLPIFFFDKVGVHPGGEGALYGNGAIGGSITLKTEAEKKEGLHVDFQQTIGSFGYTFTGGKLLWSNKKWESKTSALYNYSKNDFSFTDIDAPSPEMAKMRQNNASFRKSGVLQEVYYRASQRSVFSAKFWYMDFDRDIQPRIQDNNKQSEYESIQDKTIISLINYEHRADWMQVSLSGGYLYDKQLYKADIIATNRFVARAEVEKNILDKLIVKAGAYTEYIKPDVYSYASDVTEWRSDLYVLLLYSITPRLDVSANLRQSFITNLSPPLSPSAGLAYKIISTDKNVLKLRSTVSRNFRAPTLNDQYWGEKNYNTHLKSEKGFNVEGGFDYNFNNAFWGIQLYGTAFTNKIDNWIRWMPYYKGIWKPINVKEVLARGVDLGAKVNFTIAEINFMASGNYAFTYSKVIKASEAEKNPSEGRQSPLLPKNCWNADVNINYKKIFTQFTLSYTGETNSSNYRMPIKAYTLANVTTGYNFVFGSNKHKLLVMGTVNNLFNRNYQSVMFFAMPNRNWNISLRYLY